MSKIYVVKAAAGAAAVTMEPRLIRANTAAGAVRFALKGMYRATPASQDELVDLTSRGIKVEQAVMDEVRVLPNEPRARGA